MESCASWLRRNISHSTHGGIGGVGGNGTNTEPTRHPTCEWSVAGASRRQLTCGDCAQRELRSLAVPCGSCGSTGESIAEPSVTSDINYPPDSRPSGITDAIKAISLLDPTLFAPLKTGSLPPAPAP